MRCLPLTLLGRKGECEPFHRAFPFQKGERPCS